MDQTRVSIDLKWSITSQVLAQAISESLTRCGKVPYTSLITHKLGLLTCDFKELSVLVLTRTYAPHIIFL